MTRKILFVDRAGNIATVAAEVLNAHYAAKGINAIVRTAGFSRESKPEVSRDLCSNADVIAYTDARFQTRLRELAPRSTLVHVALPDTFKPDYVDPPKVDEVPADEMKTMLATYWMNSYGKRVLEKTLGTYADELVKPEKVYPQIDPASLQSASK